MSAYRRFGVGRLLYPFNFKKFTTMRFFLSTTVRSREEANVNIAIENELDLPFSRAKLGLFFQAMPQLGNQFNEDVTLRAYLQRHLPDNVSDLVTPVAANE